MYSACVCAFVDVCVYVHRYVLYDTVLIVVMCVYVCTNCSHIQYMCVCVYVCVLIIVIYSVCVYVCMHVY